ncbi:hypothetical protein [Listeria fleischmannii]|uniref:Uncharacterized protein n=1 Tax=Listeria fleischmannii FSL S10-1203 TaxID=1265822 RepID=W7D6P0_9LIST|nr:hypothetical protein [Listeria fleischmannii]EUJ44705.1 hypothetical protein MCOL2_19806 [Listeria fleischmannii FSL S10-1203]
MHHRRKRKVAAKENEVTSPVAEEKGNQQPTSSPSGEESMGAAETSPSDLHSLSDIEGQDAADTERVAVAPDDVDTSSRDLHSLEEMEEIHPLASEPTPISPDSEPNLKPLASLQEEEKPAPASIHSGHEETSNPSRPLHSLEKKEATEEQKELEKLRRKQVDEQLGSAPS